ncbi:hypothetical protein Bca4012_007068 [Brassica carinata]
MTQGSHSPLFQRQGHKWFQPTWTAAGSSLVPCMLVLVSRKVPHLAVTYNITQYSGVRKLETVTVAEVNAYVLNSPLRRFTDPKGSAGQETQQERPEELSFLHGALSLNHSIITPNA